jgi:alanine racemase
MLYHRRAFLASVGVVPAMPDLVLTSSRSQPAPVEVKAVVSSFDPWIEIHAANLRHNVSEIQRRAGGRPVLAVIKNNGYGLGVANVARILEPLAAIAGFAVVKLQEAATLRDAGIVKPLLLMGPFDEQDLEHAIGRDIMPMVYTPLGPALDRIAARRQRPVSIHVCVDTGIGRVGVPFREAAALIRDLAARPSVRIDGTMMTFSEHAEFDREQRRRFVDVTASLEKEGIRLGRRHAASTFTLFQHDDAWFDLVRPGMAIYGVYPEQRFRGAGVMTLRPAVALRARVAYVKRLPKGDSAGYERAYVAKDDVWVATLPVGHTDGWPRAAAKGARVRIGGRLYPVIASVSASHTIVEVGLEPSVRIGDEATLFDWQDGSRPEDVSAACGASVYDLTMHLNPLLPRRTI